MTDIKTSIIDTINYIEDNLKNELTLEMLASRVSYSKFHFSRAFIFFVGSSIMSYVLHRRLIHAINDINNGRRIIDALFDYGFETQSGFQKAFKKKFGVTPKQFLRTGKIELSALSIIKMIDKNIKGEILMEPKIIIKEKLELAGVYIETTHVDGMNLIEIPKFWEDYMTNGSMEKLHESSFVKSHEEYGVCIPKDDQNFIYLIGVETNGNEVPQDYFKITLDKQKYAVFTTPKADADKFSEKIQGTWQFIFREWLPNSIYQYDSNGLDFELYDSRSMGDIDKEMDIYIPIIEK